MKGETMNTKNVGALVAEVQRQFGAGALMDLTATAAECPSIPTGAAGLDEALGTGGYPRGRVIEVGGSPAAMLLGIRAIASVQATNGVAMFLDTRHELDIETARRLGVRIDRVLVSQPDTGEQALEIAEVCARSGAVDLIVVDDVQRLTPRAEIEGDEVMAGLRARLLSQALRKLTAIAHRVGTTIIFVRPEPPDMRAVAIGQDTGNALRFYASVRIDVRAHPEGGATMLRAKVVKNKLAPPFQDATFLASALDC